MQITNRTANISKGSVFKEHKDIFVGTHMVELKFYLEEGEYLPEFIADCRMGLLISKQTEKFGFRNNVLMNRPAYSDR